MFKRRRKSERPPPGEYPREFTEAFMQQTLPTTSPAEARSAVNHLRTKGWTEEELAAKILPYMPPAAAPGAYPGVARPAVAVPDPLPHDWLAHELPAMSREQIRHVVDELERRGWSSAKAAVAVLPHLLPKLAREDADAILTGLKDLGMSDAEIAVVAHGRQGQYGAGPDCAPNT